MKSTEYQGMEHVSAIVRARSEPGLLDWLLAQRHDGIMRSPIVPAVSGGKSDGGTTAAATVTFDVDVTDIDATYEGQSVGMSSWQARQTAGRLPTLQPAP